MRNQVAGSDSTLASGRAGLQIFPMSLGDDKTRVSAAEVNAAAQTLTPGQIFDRYRVIELLGRGGMGEVYAVRHEVLGTEFAIKLIHAEIASLPDMKQRFRDEARAMARLRHPGIVHVDEFGETDGRTWLRMELVGWGSGKCGVGSGEFGEGASLADYLKACGGRLPEAEARVVLAQVLEALDYAHGQGVVHRDLKPANILLETQFSHGGTGGT